MEGRTLMQASLYISHLEIVQFQNYLMLASMYLKFYLRVILWFKTGGSIFDNRRLVISA